MDIATVQALVGSYGFPIVVTGYLLWERHKLIGQLTGAINDMRTAIVELTSTVKGGRE